MWVYSSQHVKAVWGTSPLFQDADPESGLQILPDKDVWRHVNGVDGEVSRILASNFPGRVVVNLSQHSATNRNLVERLIADAQTGLIVAPLMITDFNSGLSFSTPLAYLIGLPQMTFSNQTQFASWGFMCPSLVPAAGVGLSTGAPR